MTKFIFSITAAAASLFGVYDGKEITAAKRVKTEKTIKADSLSTGLQKDFQNTFVTTKKKQLPS